MQKVSYVAENATRSYVPVRMAETPVGARCRDCARLYKLPTFRVETKHYVIASLVGLGMAVVVGIGWSLVLLSYRFCILT